MTLKVVEVEPAATVTLAETVTSDALPLASETTAPPAGAGALKETVPCAVPPPVRLEGLSASPESTGAGVGDGAGVGEGAGSRSAVAGEACLGWI